MNVIGKRSGLFSAKTLGVAALGLGLLGTTGCDEAAKQCGFECEGSIAENNASISGLATLDGFFGSVINFKTTGAAVAAGIKTELDGIRADFGIEAGADLGAALKAQITANVQGSLQIRTEPARCEVDAQASFKASAECQVEAGCEVMADPGNVEFECKGSCSVEASAEVSCGANVQAQCTFEGPAVACQGSCEGSCTLMAAATCEGTCEGTCSGECAGNTASGGQCNGKCSGMCTGSCKADFAASCNGTCNGSCTATGPKLDCTGAVEAKCEGSAMASVMCEGKCDGDFTPPSVMAQCDASATCNAKAEADASFSVQCTPPSIEIDYALKAGLTAEASARFEIGVRKLKTRIPALLVAIKRANLALTAAASLGDAAADAAQGSADALFSGEVNASIAYKLGTCVGPQLKAVGGVLSSTSTELKKQFDAAVSLTGAVGADSGMQS